MTILFRPGNVPSKAYRNLRDDDDCVEWKAFCEELWVRYEPYADRHFLNEIQIQFHPRFWEMYLAVTFLERGYTLHKHTDGGPEFAIDIEGKCYWFEAIAPTSGTGPDAVPDEFREDGEAIIPQEQIILRLASALAAKREKWRKELASGRVSERDGYVVAINGFAIRWAWLGAEMPKVVNALYGLGDIEVMFDRSTMKIVDSRYQHRPTISKIGGAAVSSQPFAARECPDVSAVLYSRANAAYFQARLGADFIILHNDHPTVPLPRGALRFAREYWFEDESLHMKDWSAPESAGAEA